jgi:competence protein ComEA
MKQNLATGRFPALLILLSFGTIFLVTACSRLPRTYTSEASPADTRTSAAKPARINLNNATAAELERLPGVGPVLAERIIAYRNENGRFRRAEHLMMVRGISDRKFRELRSLVRVE